MLATPNSHTIAPHVMKLPYDAAKDFTPLTLVMEVPHVLVVRHAPANSIKELVAMAKAEPEKMTYYSSGGGSTQHLAGELMNIVAGTKVAHVPYRGSSAAITDVIGGRISMGFDPTSAVLGQIQGGKLKALAVAASKRVAALPDVPTTAESGFPDLVMLTWYGLLGPAGHAARRCREMAQRCREHRQTPEFQKRITEVSAESRASTRNEFGDFPRDESAKMGKIAGTAGIKAE